MQPTLTSPAVTGAGVPASPTLRTQDRGVASQTVVGNDDDDDDAHVIDIAQGAVCCPLLWHNKVWWAPTWQLGIGT
jgi:hypothetical protein